MADITQVDLGTVPNDGTGDPLRNGGNTINENFEELESKKLEKGSYNGTAKQLDDAINNIEVDYATLTTDQTITGVKTFNTLPQSTKTPTNAADLTNKDYVDNQINGISPFDENAIHKNVQSEFDSITEVEEPTDNSLILIEDEIGRKKTIKKSSIEYQNPIDDDGRLRYIIIPENFDFTNIPLNYFNAIWVIRYVYDLGGLDVNIPENVTLKFQGGLIVNYGVITGNNTKIDALITQIFDTSGDFSGSFIINEAFPEWFGGGLNNIDNTKPINYCYKLLGWWIATGSTVAIQKAGGGVIQLQNVEYKFKNTILYRSGISLNGKKGTILRHTPDISGVNGIEADPDFYFQINQGWMNRPTFSNFYLLGDRNIASLEGLSEVGLNLSHTFTSKTETIVVSGWEIGLVLSGDGGAVYYNVIDECQFQYNRLCLLEDSGAAANFINNSVFVKHANTAAVTNYLIDTRSTLSMVGGSLEGSSINKNPVISRNGKFTMFGVHREGGFVDVQHEGSGGVSRIVTMNGYGNEPIMQTSKAFEDPSEWHDQSNYFAGYDVGGNHNYIDIIKNQYFKYGLSNWDIPQIFIDNSFYSILSKREDTYGFDNALYIEKTDINNHAIISQDINITHADTYIIVLVQKSEDALFNSAIVGIPIIGTAKLSPVYIFGEDNSSGWETWGAWVPFYDKNELVEQQKIQIGLLQSSPVGSWAKFAGVQAYVGSHPLMPSKKSVKEIFTDIPEEGFPTVGDEIFNKSIKEGEPFNWVCDRSIVTTVIRDEVLGSNEVVLNDNTNIKVGDKIGISLDNNMQHWSTVEGFNNPAIILDTPLLGGLSIGNRVNFFNFRIKSYVEELREPNLELLINPSFDSTEGWALIGDTDFLGGTANINGVSVVSGTNQNPIPLKVGSYYDIEFDILEYNSEGEALVFFITSVVLTITENGSFKFNNILYNGETPSLFFRGRNGAVFSVDNASVKEVQSLDYLALDNTIEYTPILPYEPATKKYVDDNIFNYNLNRGATPEDAGAVNGDLWVTQGHISLPDGVVMQSDINFLKE